MQTAPAFDQVPRRSGRRTKALDPLIVDRLVEASGVGCGPEEAAHYAGIGRSTYFAWLARGQKAQGARESGLLVLETERPFLDLLDRVTRKRGENAVRALASINAAAAKGHWRAAAWFLERAYPEQWGKPSARSRPRSGPSPLQQQIDVEVLEAKIDAVLRPGTTPVLFEGDP